MKILMPSHSYYPRTHGYTLTTDEGVVVEVDDEEYTFLLTDDKIAP